MLRRKAGASAIRKAYVDTLGRPIECPIVAGIQPDPVCASDGQPRRHVMTRCRANEHSQPLNAMVAQTSRQPGADAPCVARVIEQFLETFGVV